MGEALARRACSASGGPEPAELVVVERVGRPPRRAGRPLPRRRRADAAGRRRGRRHRRQARRRGRRPAAALGAAGVAGSSPSPPASPLATARGGRRRPTSPSCGPCPNTPALVGAGASAIAPGATADRRRPRLGPVAARARSAWWCGCRSPSSTRSPACPGRGRPTSSSWPRPDRGRRARRAAPRRQPRRSAVQTLLGSAELLAEPTTHAAALRAAVTSPGGTTAAGLRALESGRRARRVPRRREGRHRAVPAARAGLRHR